MNLEKRRVERGGRKSGKICQPFGKTFSSVKKGGERVSMKKA